MQQPSMWLLWHRFGKGSGYKGNGKLPEKPLVYWGYEASPFCKVRPRSPMLKMVLS